QGNIATGHTIQGTLKLVHGCFYGLIKGCVDWKLMTIPILEPCFPVQTSEQLLMGMLDDALGVSYSTEEGMGQIVQVCLGDLLISRCSYLRAIQMIPKLKLASLHKDCKVRCTQTTCGLQGVPCWLPHLRNAPVRVWECLLEGFPHLFYECGE